MKLTLEYGLKVFWNLDLVLLITYSKGCRDVKHHFIHLSHHPSGRMQLCHPHYLK
jgi:hypothetical protein